ncbi:hypothetical protein RV04_GL000372 [Enterococcus hermanniensis]|uniref:Uncharacterized protein n=1 Tax=Enterococcus hermanniensis TaxID=249189 RepID=A0A1L8TS26_9ENTE|nr:hypothetical protein RV04_GL000372 [Enterococcus hermanniensis]
MGIVVQTILTIILLIILVGYHGKKYSRIKPIGYSYFSIRYAVIVLSFIINGIVLFLYVLNYLGINHVIFAAI